VLEEAYLRGMFDAPDFYENRHEYTRAAWIGGGWGWVDPVKEVEASRLAIDYGLSTLAEEVAGQGRDWEEVLEQRAREQARAKELDVTLMSSGKGNKENGDTSEKGE
jgi:capsid protein